MRMTIQEWKDKGFQVVKGAQKVGTLNNGKKLFSQNQVERVSKSRLEHVFDVDYLRDKDASPYSNVYE